jgi:hypothetical protein
VLLPEDDMGRSVMGLFFYIKVVPVLFGCQSALGPFPELSSKEKGFNKNKNGNIFVATCSFSYSS